MGCAGKQAMRIELRQQRLGIRHLAEPGQTHRIEPFKDIEIVTVAGGMAVGVPEPNVLKSGDNSLFTSRTSADLRRPIHCL